MAIALESPSAESSRTASFVFGVALCVVVGFVGLYHCKKTTTGGSRTGDVLVWLAYFSTPATALVLLFRYGTVSPLLAVLALAYRLLTDPSLGGGPDGYYPGLIIVVWPTMLVLSGLLAGTEAVVKGVLFGELA